MSKQIKQMQMDVLAGQFKDVREMVLFSAQGLDAITENNMRLDPRKKNIRLQMVKNSLLRRVFGAMGLEMPEAAWAGPTIVAWGGDNIKGLSKEVETYVKNDK